MPVFMFATEEQITIQSLCLVIKSIKIKWERTFIDRRKKCCKGMNTNTKFHRLRNQIVAISHKTFRPKNSRNRQSLNSGRTKLFPNTTADKEIIVQSPCIMINTKKQYIIETRQKEDLGYAEPLAVLNYYAFHVTFHIIHMQRTRPVEKM